MGFKLQNLHKAIQMLKGIKKKGRGGGRDTHTHTHREEKATFYCILEGKRHTEQEKKWGMWMCMCVNVCATHREKEAVRATHILPPLFTSTHTERAGMNAKEIRRVNFIKP